MTFRKLRIAWSVVSGLIAMVLCVFWALGYWREIGLETDNLGFQFETERGRFQIDVNGPLIWKGGNRIDVRSDAYDESNFYVDLDPELTRIGLSQFYVVCPCWVPVGICGALAAAVWLPRRFSLRTLLVGMTVVAVVLSVVLVLRR